MLWLHIHFSKLALESRFLSEQRPIPQLLLQPGQQTVMQCNDYASQQGVRIGMNKKTAYCLLDDCVIADYDYHLEQESLKHLALQCYHQSAQISLIEPQGLLLELSSMLSLFGGLSNYIQHLKNRLNKIGFSYLMSTAHTPAAAKVLAQAGFNLFSDDKQTIEQTLTQLSIQKLSLPRKTVEKLNAMGIHTYQQLKQTPRRELGYRFGIELIDKLSSLEHDNRPPTSFRPPERFQQTLHLNYDAEQAQGLLFPMRRALLNLEAYLLSRQQVCEKLLIKLEHRNGQVSLLTVSAVRGSYRQQDWITLVQLQLDNFKLIDPVISLTVRASGFLTMEASHQDLVGDRYYEADCDRMHSLLLARIGESNLQTLRPEVDPRPEVSSQLQPSHMIETTLFSRQWPCFLLSQPETIQASDYQIISGPERIEGGWWDANPTRRDYYIAQKDLQVLWIFRRDDGHWFLHGIYS